MCRTGTATVIHIPIQIETERRGHFRKRSVRELQCFEASYQTFAKVFLQEKGR